VGPLKRGIDVALGALALVCTAPMGVAVGVAIWLLDGRPVLFRQRRSGLRGRPFTMLKFRTMRAAASDEWRPEHDRERITALGRVLRSTSLDELPTLLNVVRGDMSLVGPRPLPVDYLSRYDARQLRRLEVRPGITGWAVVNGRNTLSWDERLELDVWYVDRRSVRLDARILARSVPLVLRRAGVNLRTDVTMTEFLGPGS
jgi:lipopolysaccharide/colanic/teichoic acid biosynthesis glycosyltransferase